MPVRVIPLSHRSHITGRQPFVPGMRSIGHESTLERDFVTLCRFDPDVLGIEEQPVRIDWIDTNGRMHRYTPDYRVVRRTHVDLVEVKYRSDLWTNWNHYRPALIAGRDWAVARGMRFRIATERHIRTGLLRNAKRLIPRMQDTVPAEVERHIVNILNYTQPTPLADLVEAATGVEFPRDVILSAIWPLLARRSLMTALDYEITGQSVLHLAMGRR